MTIPPEILDATIETFEWMTRQFIWMHDQCELPTENYSPELRKAIDLLDFLKRFKEELKD
jgi:hypothetical protein